MRFSAIAVTFAALAAQVTLTSGMNELDCFSKVDECFEVVPTCDGDDITYCLQPKVPYGADCKTDSYSHMNVYLNGNGVNLINGNALGTSECLLPLAGADEGDQCQFAAMGNTKSCDLLEGFQVTPRFGGLGNVGRKCGPTLSGLCVTIPHLNQEQIIFAVKDGNGCTTGGEWNCNEPAEGHTCSCSGAQAACVYEVENVNCPAPPPTAGPPTGGGGGANGDPHFKTWRGKHFDYHGECDLVLLRSSEFGSGLGLDVHIRTKFRRDMSYISSAVLRIGSDVLEVESQGIYYLNGVAGAALPDEFSGFAFSHTQPSDKQHVFEVHLGGPERIKVKTYKDFVSVLIEQGGSMNFGDSVGLMGDFEQGRMIARDGNTVFDDANAFGQEWQVLETEPSLFQTLRFPQHPMECSLPTPMLADHLRRRLLESSSVDELAAEKACEHWGEGKDDCVFDVLTTGDLEMAIVGAY
jgi:hypothetical protein